MQPSHLTNSPHTDSSIAHLFNLVEQWTEKLHNPHSFATPSIMQGPLFPNGEALRCHLYTIDTPKIQKRKRAEMSPRQRVSLKAHIMRIREGRASSPKTDINGDGSNWKMGATTPRVRGTVSSVERCVTDITKGPIAKHIILKSEEEIGRAHV